MTKEEKWKRLEQLASQDEVYVIWKGIYNESAVKVGKFMKWCPPKLRNLLNDYADSGRLMMQRIAGLALSNMEFKDE